MREKGGFLVWTRMALDLINDHRVSHSLPVLLNALSLLLLILPCSSLGASDCIVADGNSFPAPIVSVTQGQLRGKVCVARNDRKFGAFLGIPYAKPPARFQVAEPPVNWHGRIRNADNYQFICPQVDAGTGAVVGSEDCLFLNVFMPIFDTPSKKLLPVIVFLSDDNFQHTGPPDTYGPEFFMEEDIVMVTLNYRLGALGFLTFGNDQILSANLGLKDQVLALKWIQANIHVFGGDRSRITLLGSGSGSVAVSLHLLSPMSAGLFSNGISSSGTYACPNALVLDPSHTIVQLSHLLKCSNLTSSPNMVTSPRQQAQLLTCLKTRNFTDIILAQEKLTGWEKLELVTPFGPTVETPSEERVDLFKSRKNQGNLEDNLFLPDFPENLLKTEVPRVPWIVGVNSKPGYSPSVSVLKNNATYLDFLNKNWEKVAPLLFHYLRTSNTPPLISEKVREFYFYNERVDLGNLEQLYTALSDQNHFQCAKKSALTFGLVAPVYVYYLTYQRVNFLKAPEVNGVEYMAELQYLFKFNRNYDLQISTKSRSLGFSRSLVKLWVSFAKYNTPNATWPKSGLWNPIPQDQLDGHRSLRWLKLDNELSTIREPFFARVNFWSHLATNSKLVAVQNSRWALRVKKRAEMENELLLLSTSSSSSSSSNIIPPPREFHSHQIRIFMLTLLALLSIYPAACP